MPTEQPSSAPDAVAPRDTDTAAAVLRDDTSDTPSGGRGPRSDDALVPSHGTAPNAPIDTGLPAESAEAEARHRATAAS